MSTQSRETGRRGGVDDRQPSRSRRNPRAPARTTGANTPARLQSPRDPEVPEGAEVGNGAGDGERPQTRMWERQPIPRDHPASVPTEARSSSGPGDRRAEARDMNATPGDKVLRGESPSPSPAWFSDRWRPGQPEAPGSRPVGRSLENREHLQAPASRGAECRTLPARRGCLRQAPRPPPRGKRRRAAWGG